MLAQRSLLTKLSFGFGAVIVLLITVAVVAVDRMGAMNDAEQRIVALHVAGIRQTGAIRTETVWLLARQFQRTYAIDPARQAEYDKDIRARLKHVAQLLTDFSALDLAPEERTLCDEYRALWTPYAELCEKFLSLVADNRVSEANMLLLGDMSESHTTLLNS